MARSPQFKVFNPRGEYVAACKHAEDAAAIVAAYGKGADIRWGHSAKDTLYIEGEETCRADDSYDAVAAICNERLQVINDEFVAAERKRKADRCGYQRPKALVPRKRGGP